VLGVVFLAETLVMVLLPTLARHVSPSFVPVLDATVLILLAAPLLWWLVVRPARHEVLERARQRETEVAALLTAARAVLEVREFSAAARVILAASRNAVGAEAGYIALIHDRGAESDGLYLDGDGRLRRGEPSLAGLFAGLRSGAYQLDRTVYFNQLDRAAWSAILPAVQMATRNVLLAPLKLGERTIGLLGLADKPGGFSDADTRLATGFAELAVVAVKHSQSLAALEARERDLRLAHAGLEHKVQEARALYEFATQVGGLHDLSAILTLAADRARVLLRGDGSAVCLATKCPGKASMRATSGNTTGFCAGEEGGACWDRAEDGPTRHACGALRGAHLAAHVGVPLRHGAEVIGALCVGSSTARVFTPSETDLLCMLATQAAIAIEKTELYDEIRRLTALKERQRISRDIHDGLAQALALLHFRLSLVHKAIKKAHPDMVEGLEEAMSLSRHAYEDTRHSISVLRTDRGTGEGSLIQAVKKYGQDFTREHGIPVEVEAHHAVPLSPASEVQVMRIVQEALANTWRHAQADQLKIRMDGENGLVLTIEDDGCGFDPAAVGGPDRDHFGLQIMRERAEGLGGKLTVASRPGRGTRIVVSLPAGA
jgi:signal transduction histidine kinase